MQNLVKLSAEDAEVAANKDEFLRRGLSVQELEKVKKTATNRDQARAAQEMIDMTRNNPGLLRLMIRNNRTFISLLDDSQN